MYKTENHKQTFIIYTINMIIKSFVLHSQYSMNDCFREK